MTLPVAFRATYADWKLIKTRGVIQVVMEVPLADADAAYDVLGGMPNPANETWFGIAPINLELPVQKEARAASRQVAPSPKPDGTKRDWRDMKPSAQAAIRCGEAIFWAFLNEECGYNVNSKEEAAEAVRDKCGVISRKLLDQEAFHKNRTIWNLLDSGYSAWKALEHA